VTLPRVVPLLDINIINRSAWLVPGISPRSV
jgi:hypothetical protein